MKRGKAAAVAAVVVWVFSLFNVTGLPVAAAETEVPLETRLADRVLLHRNAVRGMEYVPTSQPGASAAAKSSLKVDILKKINLDGNAIDNTYSSVLPIDSDNDGQYGFLHWNGHRIMRLYDGSGRKVWQVTNGTGRKQGSEAYTHRDTAVVMDMNGDGKDDVLHCWQSGSTKLLVARHGSTGKEIRKISLPGQSNSLPSYCLLSVYRKQADKQPIILMSQQQPGGSGMCGKKNYTDNWVRVVAYDTSLKKLWHADTCHAGHQTAGVDADNDGYQEYFFVGKYALDFNGKIRCTLKGWAAGDHVDAIRVGKLDPKSPRVTAIAVGFSGGGAFDASNCKWLWGFSKTIDNPQELSIVQIAPAPKPLSVMVTQRGSEKNTKTYILDANGKILRTIAARILPMQNAELDGDERTDEIVGMFGDVFNGAGKKILSRNWYWNLKGTKVAEKSSSNVYDKWIAFPLLFDLDSDGRNEFVTWGQSLIAVGRPH